MIPEGFVILTAPPTKEQSARGTVSFYNGLQSALDGGQPTYALRQDLAEAWYAKHHKEPEPPPEGGYLYESVFG